MRRARTAVPMLALLAAAAATVLSGGVAAANGGSANRVASARTPGTIVIGSTNFTEQFIVASLYGDALEHAGFRVQVRSDLGTRAEVVPALEHGALDLEPDYAGTLLLYFDESATKQADRLSSAVPALKTFLGKHGATVLRPAKAIDTNVFAITKTTDRKYHLGPSPALSQLKPIASKLVLGGPSECPKDATCEPGLEKVYGLHFKSFQSTDESGPISVAALKDGTVQVAEFFSSDGQILRNHFIALRDDRHMQAADELIPVIRKSVDTPKVAATLDAVSAKLTTTQLAKMNLAVNVRHESPGAVAKAWLAAEHLG